MGGALIFYVLLCSPTNGVCAFVMTTYEPNVSDGWRASVARRGVVCAVS